MPIVGPMLPEVAEHGPHRPQNVIEAEIFARLAGHPRHPRLQAERPGRARHLLLDPVDNEADLNDAVARLEAALRGDPLLANVASEGALPRPEMQITPRAEEAARLGITTRADRRR